MNIHRLHWRISFGPDVFYHIIAISNVPKNSKTVSWAESYGGYTDNNGFAFILSKEPASYNEHEPIFVQNGTAEDAMFKMVKLLEELHKKECLKQIIKL